MSLFHLTECAVLIVTMVHCTACGHTHKPGREGGRVGGREGGTEEKDEKRSLVEFQLSHILVHSACVIMK